MKPAPLILAAAIWCVVLATVRFHEYGIYQLSKWAITAVAIYAAVELPKVRWLLAAVAVAFNPIMPIRFSREAWRVVDVAAAGVFVASIIRT